jgi:hypothetical protein
VVTLLGKDARRRAQNDFVILIVTRHKEFLTRRRNGAVVFAAFAAPPREN